MSTPSMRWSPGQRQSWKNEEGRELFDPDGYDVAAIPDDTTAKDYVLDRHYSGSYPSANQRYGLYHGHELAGVAVLSSPTQARVLTNVFPALEPYCESLELGRFVLDDAVPYNAESWFLGQVFSRAAEAGVRGVVSFSDPLPRTDSGGRTIMPGHVGTIYQATNARYLGRATARTLAMLPDGTVFSDRAAQKVRDQAKGHEYAERLLVKWGARPMRAGEDPRAWLREALEVAARVRHNGNHRYAFTLGRSKAERRRVAVAQFPELPYPKFPDLGLAA